MSRSATTPGAPGIPRNPRGWEQLVAQLNAIEDRGGFLRAMLELQCRVVSAEYGAMWELDGEGKPRLAVCWQANLTQADAGNPVYRLLEQAAKGGFERGLSHALRIQNEGAATSGGDATTNGYIYVTVLRSGAKPGAVSTVVAECRGPDVVLATAPVRELAAGMYEGFQSRRQARAHEQEAQRIRQAMALLGAVQEGRGFGGAALNLVNELARQLGCQRVSLGWIKGRSVHLLAMSDTERVKRHSEQAVLLEMAMAECLDQQQPIVYPAPADAEPVLAQAVVYSHRKLAGTQGGRHVMSVPLRQGDDWLGVLTLERQEQSFDAATVSRLQLTADVAAPQLHDRHDSDRWLIGHLWQVVRRYAAYLVGPRQVGWKLLGLAVATLVVLAALGTWPYQVSSSFRLESHQRRVVSAPYQGRIKRVLARPNDVVTAGQVLAELDARELRLQKIEAEAQGRLAGLQYDQALAEGKQSEARIAAAARDQVQARIDLLRDQIERAAITSPIDGVVLDGQWDDQVGGVVEQGKALFVVAPSGRLTAVLRVHESDIHHLLEKLRQPGAQVRELSGALATRGEPEQEFAFHVQRIVPLAKSHENANVFEVWCDLDQEAEWLKPGMEGLAQVDVGRRPIVWILTHRIVDTVRLWLWW